MTEPTQPQLPKTDWSRETFERGLFNLITQHGNTGLLFSKRNLITQELIRQFDLLVLQYREDSPKWPNPPKTS